MADPSFSDIYTADLESLGTRDPQRGYGTILPISWEKGAQPGNRNWDPRGGLTGDILGLLLQFQNAQQGKVYTPVDAPIQFYDPDAVTRGMTAFATPGVASGARAAVANPAAAMETFGVFAGPQSNRGLGVLNNMLAAALEKSGMSPENIWKATGYFRGAEGKWRYEIPDVNSVYNAGVRRLSPNQRDFPQGTTLEQVLEHPELYKAYPELKKTPVESFYDSTTNSGGYYNPDNKSIGINTALPAKNQYSTLMHEIQHAIQETEKFASGADPASFVPTYVTNKVKALDNQLTSTETALINKGANRNDLESLYKHLSNETPLPLEQKESLIKSLQTQGLSPDDITRYATLISSREKYLPFEEKAMKQYRNAGGERESREVEKRLLNKDTTSLPHRPNEYKER